MSFTSTGMCDTIDTMAFGIVCFVTGVFTATPTRSNCIVRDGLSLIITITAIFGIANLHRYIQRA